MDRIVSITIEGFRSIERTTLPLNGLTVLIGENGTGKSTLLEALEVVSKAIRPGNGFAEVLQNSHGPFRDLLRSGASKMSFSIRVEGDGPGLTWTLVLEPQPGRIRAAVTAESLVADGNGTPILVRKDGKQRIKDVRSPTIQEVDVGSDDVSMAWVGHSADAMNPALGRMRGALDRIRLHVPLDVRPLWIAEETRAPAHLRQPSMVEPATRLNRLGLNLANCFQELNNRGARATRDVLDDVRAGLGDDIESVQTPSTARGYIDLAVKFRSLAEPIYSAGLSDGQLSYLAFVVLKHLDEDGIVLSVDEPESHLHPALLVRASWLLESIAKRHSVILATHSDALLDALTDPARQVRVCELGTQREQVLRTLDAARLEKWRSEYSSLGEIRRAGLTHMVLREEGGP